MSAAKTKSVRKVLFVDDNVMFIDMIERVFTNWTKDSWQYLRATNAGKGMALMEEHVVDLVVIDMNLPGVNGLQFLRLSQQRHSNVPKVIMTGNPDDANQKACLDAGAHLYLAKPKSLDEMEGVYLTLNELTKWQENQGFRGMMRQTTLPEILQMECLNKNSSLLEVKSGFNRSEIYIRNGEIIHADGGGHKGQQALSYILSLKGGEFNIRPFVEPPETTMSGSWEGMLMEAAQSSDEGGETISPKLTERPTSNATIEALQEKSLASQLAALEEAITPEESHTEVFSEEILAPRVDEMLVCTSKGDVLYEWQCPKPDRRIEFMEIVDKQTQKLTAVLGSFDRFELLGERDHVLIRIKPGNKIFLRAHNPATSMG